MKVYSLKLRKILLLDYLYYILFGIAIIYFAINSLIPRSSLYNINDNNFEGKIISYNIDGNTLSMIIKGKEKLKCTYYFQSEEEKNEYVSKLRYGITLKLKGTLSKPINNTIPNTFNYKKYLYHQNIYYLLEIESLDIVNKESVFYKSKNLVNNYLLSFKNYDYLLTFVLGNKNYLNYEISTNYKTLGVSHLFAISGMHISLFSTSLLLILKKLKVTENKRYLIVMLFLLFYTFLTNFSPSVLRASLFFTLLSLNKIYYTFIKPINIYLVTLSILIFINYNILFDLGAQYSFMTSFGLILFSNKLNGKNYLINLLKISFIAFLFSLPITAINFYKVNLLTIINNLFFVPLISLIIYPFSLIVLFLPFLEFLLSFLINILEYMSIILSKFNLNFIIPKTSIVLWLIYYFLVILFLKNNKLKYLLILIVLLTFNRYQNKFDNNYYMYYLDVGQGDSALLINKHQKDVTLIDTGGKLAYEKEDWEIKSKTYHQSDTLIYFFNSLGINEITNLVITHGDEDHMGEALNIVKNIKVNQVIFNNGEYNNLELALIKFLDDKNIFYYQNIKDLNIDNNKIYFLNQELYNNENDNSNVLYMELDKIKMLLMGDAGIKTEQNLKYKLENIDILKVGHHGSKNSSSENFINQINPKYAIISVGKNNRYNHPNDKVLEILKDSNIYRTDQLGTIRFKIKENKLKIKTYAP